MCSQGLPLSGGGRRDDADWNGAEMRYARNGLGKITFYKHGTKLSVIAEAKGRWCVRVTEGNKKLFHFDTTKKVAQPPIASSPEMLRCVAQGVAALEALGASGGRALLKALKSGRRTAP